MNFNTLTQAQLDKVLVDEGIVFINYGETDEAQLGVVRGGSEFTATPTWREIEADGKRGKTKGLKVLEELNAMMKLSLISFDQALIGKISPLVEAAAVAPYDLSNAVTGAVVDSQYLKNVTMFCKTLDGEFKQVTIYNALNEGALVVSAKPKSEGELPLEFHAHWDNVTPSDNLYKIVELTALPA